jgi:hypothetical protein
MGWDAYLSGRLVKRFLPRIAGDHMEAVASEFLVFGSAGILKTPPANVCPLSGYQKLQDRRFDLDAEIGLTKEHWFLITQHAFCPVSSD